MESSRFMCELPSAENFFRRLEEKGYRPRSGQRTFWEIVNYNQKTLYLGVLPTGYGKSDTALGSFMILAEQQRVNRMLIIVPTDTQRSQYIKDLTESVARLGGDMPLSYDERDSRRKRKGKNLNEMNVARRIEHETSDLRMSWENRCWIFVTTVQSVLFNGNWYRDLMSKCEWLTFFDEYHKLNAEESARWGKAAQAIKGKIVLGLTATPIRSDDSPTIFNGLPVDVTVSFEQAYAERAIRGVVAHVEHYFVDMRGPDGETVRITTETLRNVTDWDNYQTKRGLRFIDEYLSGMLSAAYDCLMNKNLKHPDQHQMLVFAMNLDHAEHVSGLLNSVYGEGFSDWVGVRRTDEENDDIMDKYDRNDIPCLVQVDKATEGFNNKRASVLVFLNLIRKNTVKAAQSAGRGVRRNGAIADFSQDLCDMFASSDTDWADLIQDYSNLTVGQDKDYVEVGPEAGPGGNGLNGTPVWTPLPPFESDVISAEFDRSEIISPSDIKSTKEFFIQRGLREIPESIPKDQSLAFLEERFNDKWVADTLKRQKDSEILIAFQARKEIINRNTVTRAANRLAGHVIRVIYKNSAPTTAFKVAITRINDQWIRESGRPHKAWLDEDLKRKYDWIEAIGQHINASGEVPSWLAI